MESPTTETATETSENTELTSHEILSQRFGQNYHGEAPILDTSNTEESEETDTEEDSEEEVEQEEAEQEQGEEEEETAFSFQDLIEHNELDTDLVYGLKVPVKIMGEEGNAPLKDVIASYQTQEAAEKILAKAKETRTQADEQTRLLAEKGQQVETTLEEANGILAEIEEAFTSENNGINWADLRKNHPAEYAAKKQEISERKEMLDSLKEKLKGQHGKTKEAKTQEAQENYTKYLQGEVASLLEKLPEWKDQETANTERTALAEYLESQGLTKEEVNATADHRLIVLARKAMLFDQGQKKTDTAKKKVKGIPKMVKPGTVKSSKQTENERISSLKNRVSQTGRMDDFHALINERLNK